MKIHAYNFEVDHVYELVGFDGSVYECIVEKTATDYVFRILNINLASTKSWRRGGGEFKELFSISEVVDHGPLFGLY